jgi:hypothetical protein
MHFRKEVNLGYACELTDYVGLELSYHLIF